MGSRCRGAPALPALAGGLLAVGAFFLVAAPADAQRAPRPDVVMEAYCDCACRYPVFKDGKEVGTVGVKVTLRESGGNPSACPKHDDSECRYRHSDGNVRVGKLENCRGYWARLPPGRQVVPPADGVLAPLEPTPSPGTRQMVPRGGGVLAPR